MADQRESSATGASGPQALRLQSASDVRVRREQVLSKYEGFKEAARKRREKLEGAKMFQQFKRNADELEAWVNEKMQIVSDESHKDRTNLQVRHCAVEYKWSDGIDECRVYGGGACELLPQFAKLQRYTCIY